MNRRLVLLRHAKSAWPDLPDHERPLATRGRRDAPAVGRWLREAGLMPDRVLCSTALRTRETWQLMVPELGTRLPPVSYEDQVYEAHCEALLDLARQSEPAASSTLIIGHNPGVQDLALMLAAAGDGDADAVLLQRATAKFPTAAVAVLAFAGAWSRLGPGRAQLITFVTPSDLRRADQLP
jgi:phosphohistidine phosphatase